MPIPTVILSDEIKASDDYLNYLAKSLGTKQSKGKGKGMITKKGVERVVETVRVLKKRHLKTVIEETGESNEVADMLDSKEIEEKDEEALDHFKKLNRVERMTRTSEYLLEMKQARKASKQEFILKQHPKGPGEGSGVAPEVLDGPSGSSSSPISESEDEIEDILSDEVDDMEKPNDSKKVDDEQDAEEQAEDEQAGEEQHVDDQGGNEQARDVQAEVYVFEYQIEKPEATIVSSSLTLSSVEYENQFLNNNPDVSINEVLKEPVEAEVQSMVDVPIRQENLAEQRPSLVDTTVTLTPETKTLLQKQQPPQPKRSKIKVILKKSKKQVDVEAIDKRLTRLEKKVDAMSKIDHTEAVDKSVQAHLKNVLPKDVLDFGKIKLEKSAKQQSSKYSTKPFDAASLKEYDLKDKLMKLMSKSKSYKTHPAHRTLYDALLDSLLVDEDDMDKQLEDQPSQTERRDDDQDPLANANKQTKKRKRKDFDAPSSKKSKDKEEPSKGTKAPSGPSPTEKVVDDEELLQDGVVDDIDMAQDVDMDVDDMPHDDAAPKSDNSKWFKQDAVERPETLDPEWHKEPNDVHEQSWFNEMVNAKKDPLTFDDLMASTVDFTMNYIKLEYNMEQCYLALTYQLDWANPEGDRYRYDLSKPLPLQGHPGRTTIPMNFFFNKDLEYLMKGNIENMYASSLTKPKAARYELEGLEEMILNLWSSSKEGYDLNAVER
ncbi:hypothetical protein Tco_1134842 [Tanacetum coccineum]